jgi:peptide/nickel transport system ATP-binding protein/oligopeptide transport system ATP-binding protein
MNQGMNMNKTMIETIGLKTWFKQKSGIFSGNDSVVKAVDDISLKIYEGETLGLVGESGCGKSTLGRTILNLTPATGGQVLFQGKNLVGISQKEMREYRRKMQLIFQNPYSSLNPRKTIRESVKAPLQVYKEDRNTMDEQVEAMLSEVGLSEACLDRFPHEFSGGQRQRIVIARALILNPQFVVCDEPVSALDVSVRAQVLNLMKDLQEKRNLTYLFISHDLSVVKHISSRIAVMYLGEIVELAGKEELFSHPKHPYTQALLSAIPIARAGRKRERIHLQGDVANVHDLPAGCKFHTRCPHATKRCEQEKPSLCQIADGHFCACHLCQ